MNEEVQLFSRTQSLRGFLRELASAVADPGAGFPERCCLPSSPQAAHLGSKDEGFGGLPSGVEVSPQTDVGYPGTCVATEMLKGVHSLE